MDDETALKFFRLRAHVALMQGMFFRLLTSVAPLVLPHRTPKEATQALLRAIAGGLEKDSVFVQKMYLSDEVLSGMPDAKRVLYAEEFRETVETVKSSIEAFLRNI